MKSCILHFSLTATSRKGIFGRDSRTRRLIGRFWCVGKFLVAKPICTSVIFEYELQLLVTGTIHDDITTNRWPFGAVNYCSKISDCDNERS